METAGYLLKQVGIYGARERTVVVDVTVVDKVTVDVEVGSFVIWVLPVS